MKHRKGIIGVSLSDEDVDADLVKKIGEIEPGRYQRLTISDSGSGIEPDIMERIFEPFFTTKEAGIGTGMGLSVVHGIVKNNKGAVYVTSIPGKGSRFDIYFPLMDLENVHEIPMAESEPPTGVDRILVVDDEIPLVKLYRDTLMGLGYIVMATEDPIKAFSLFKEQSESVDLVITDMTMPKMSGMDLSEKIMAIRPDIPIILCTGFSEMVNEDEAKKIGIKAFLMKPVTRQNLAQLVRSTLDQSTDSF